MQLSQPNYESSHSNIFTLLQFSEPVWQLACGSGGKCSYSKHNRRAHGGKKETEAMNELPMLSSSLLSFSFGKKNGGWGGTA